MDGDRNLESFRTFGFSLWTSEKKEEQSTCLCIYSWEWSLVIAMYLEEQHWLLCKCPSASTTAPSLLLSLFLIMLSPQLSFFFLFFTSETSQFPFPGDVWGSSFDSDEPHSERENPFWLPCPCFLLAWTIKIKVKQLRINYGDVQARRSLVLEQLLISQNILTVFSHRARSCQQATCGPPISSTGVPQAGSWGLPAPLRSA